MNSLDDLFERALDREALPTTQERRHAVAEVTVTRVRRRRRLRASAQGAGAIALVCAAAVGGAWIVGRDGPSPAIPAPAPSQSDSSVAPPSPQAAPEGVVSAFADENPLMPLEAPMTAEDWAALDASWNVEFAAESSGGRSGSWAQLYLQPPGGERRFAYGYPSFTLSAPIMLAMDPDSMAALMFDADTKTLNSVDLISGVTSEIQNELDARIVDAAPLGRSSDGASAFAIETVDGSGATAHRVFTMVEGGAQGLPLGGGAPSPVWGDLIVTNSADGFAVTNLITEDERAITGYPDCEFLLWNLDGSFDVHCKTATPVAPDVLTIDPSTGDVTVSPYAGAGLASWDVGPLRHAIDRERWWMGEGTSGREVYPPFVEGEDPSANLSTGFSALDTYAVIFGIRN